MWETASDGSVVVVSTKTSFTPSPAIRDSSRLSAEESVGATMSVSGLLTVSGHN